jgi:superfamily II DNA or RNA helicase
VRGRRELYVPVKDIIPTYVTKISNIIPFQYQLDAERKILEKFIKRGILSMPCGTGKTYISYLISKHYKQVIILSPSKQNTKQNLDKFVEYGYFKDKTQRVDSDGERDITEVEAFILENEEFLISATYDSVDVIRKALKFMDNPLIIVDEFHNLSKRNVLDKDDDFYNVLHSEEKILFMSATPRVYELENEFNEVYTDDIFGPIVYSMPFTEAIKKKYVADYKIWLPSITPNDEETPSSLLSLPSSSPLSPSSPLSSSPSSSSSPPPPSSSSSPSSSSPLLSQSPLSSPSSSRSSSENLMEELNLTSMRGSNAVLKAKCKFLLLQ